MKAKIAGLITLAIAGGGAAALLGASSATAATPTTPAPAITNDPNASLGNLVFYNSSGNIITSGNNLNRLFDYAAATTAGRTGASKATVYFAFPDHTQSDSNNWNSQLATVSSTYPNANAPAPLKSFSVPLNTAANGDANLQSLLATTTLDHTAGYDGIVQVRLYDGGPGFPTRSVFWASDIWFDPVAGTWQQVDRNPATTSISAVTASPANPAPQGTTAATLSATLSASDGSHPAGSVELFDGSNDLGPATFNAATGAISKAATVVDGGNYNFKFVYSPTQPIGTSTSPVLAYRVKTTAPATTTTVSGPTTANVGDNVPYTATVSSATQPNPGAGDGAVQFTVDGSNAGSPVTLNSSGVANFMYAASAPGTHTISGNFVPADPTNYQPSNGSSIALTVSAPQYAPDPQTFKVTVPQGTLVISTPYTSANPFDLGTMQLNAAGTQYTASAPFGDPAVPGAGDPGNGAGASTTNGVTITDTRAGSTGWTAYIGSTDFSNGNATPISGDNLSFTGVAAKYPANNGLAGKVKTYDVAGGMKTVKQKFADTTSGPGTVNITGTMGLTAPSSTLPGSYTATVTFTVV